MRGWLRGMFDGSGGGDETHVGEMMRGCRGWSGMSMIYLKVIFEKCVIL